MGVKRGMANNRYNQNYRHKARLKKKKWTGVWWKDPKLEYRGIITKPPLNRMSKEYRYWRKCAWALIYNPNTPVWLRIILQEQTKFKRTFDKKEYKRNRWLRLFFRNWSKRYLPFFSLKKRARWAKVDKYHKAYKTFKKLTVLRKKFRINHYMLGTKGASNYFNLQTYIYRLSNTKQVKTRQRKWLRPATYSVRYTSNIYTVQYLRKTQFSLLLRNPLNKSYTTRTTFFHNILPIKTLKSFLWRMKKISWKRNLLLLDSSLLRFLYTFNLASSKFSYFTAISKGFILLNNSLTNIRESLKHNDILLLKKQFFIKGKLRFFWKTAYSWRFWLMNYYTRIKSNYSFVSRYLMGQSDNQIGSLFVFLQRNKRNVFKPFTYGPRKMLWVADHKLVSARRIRKLKFLFPRYLKKNRWSLLRNRITIAEDVITSSHLYTYINPGKSEYDVIKMRSRSLYAFLLFISP